ncbi:FMN-binding glutamate synthase family protein [Kaarinaea lacus]
MFTVVDYLASLFVFVIGIVVLATAVLYAIDVTQTKHAIRRNFPVIGRLRGVFEHLGEFFRQYFFALDREELPFNRAERNWVYRAAKSVDNTVAFGSTRDLRPPGTLLFVNTAFPVLGQDATPIHEVTIGPNCEKPYIARSLINISAMSYGAISRPAVIALSRGAKKAGCWLNTGEGGLSPYHLEGGADLVFQIGTAKYGVRDDHGHLSENRLQEIAAHDQVKMFEIKLSQGAKPGKGGILPGSKVTEEISRIRGIPKYQDSISPNRHPEIEKVGDILDMVQRVRNVTGKPVGFKAVMGSYEWLDELCIGIKKRGIIDNAPDFISLDSADGGTGAAPMSLMDYVGLPIRESLPAVVDLLEKHGLKERIKVIASGKLITPAEVAWAYCVGADFVATARGFMFALGCIQALQCNKNTCPTGITTHDRRLQKGLNLDDKALRVANYAKNLTHEVCVIAHSCGVRGPREMNRTHVRMVMEDGKSVPLSTIYGSKSPVAGSLHQSKRTP